jgi:hypothetical protein
MHTAYHLTYKLILIHAEDLTTGGMLAIQMPRNTLGDIFQPSDTICKYRSFQTSKHVGVLQNNQRLIFPTCESGKIM